MKYNIRVTYREFDKLLERFVKDNELNIQEITAILLFYVAAECREGLSETDLESLSEDVSKKVTNHKPNQWTCQECGKWELAVAICVRCNHVGLSLLPERYGKYE